MENSPQPNAPEFRPRVRIPYTTAVWDQSHGEVTTPETLDFRTMRAVPGGLFCQRIFGPLRDWHCACGTLTGLEHAGQTCWHCHVLVAPRRVRRRRYGHINLPETVCHPEFVHVPESPLSEWCGLDPASLQDLVYRRRYRVLFLPRAEPDPLSALRAAAKGAGELRQHADTLDRLLRLREGDTLSREAMEPVHQLRAALADQPEILARLPALRTGAEALRWLLARTARGAYSGVLLECLPVIPAGLREFEPRDAKTVRWHDVNDLYRRVLHRARRLRRLRESPAPIAVLDREREQLQRAVDGLIANDLLPEPIRNERGRPMRCLVEFAGIAFPAAPQRAGHSPEPPAYQ